MTAPELQVPSTEAETAAALLFRTLGAHRDTISTLESQPSKRLRQSSAGDSFQDRCQATLVRLLSITESFAADLLSREVSREIANGQSLIAIKLAEEAVIRATSTWQEQKKGYKDWLGVEVDWKAIERLAEARNSVAHGLGRLTKRQLRNEQSVKSKLKAAGITVEGDRIILSDKSLLTAALSCRNFIESLDLTVRARWQTAVPSLPPR